MSNEHAVLAKPCQRQKDKVFIDGTLEVKQTVLVWQPAQGQDDDLRTFALLSIKGMTPHIESFSCAQSTLIKRSVKSLAGNVQQAFLFGVLMDQQSNRAWKQPCHMHPQPD